MADHPHLVADHTADPPPERRRALRPRHFRALPSAPPRRAIRPLLVLVALVNLAWSMYQLPVTRIVESRLCRDHYAVHDPSALRPDGSVPEELCKVDMVQQRLGRIQGIAETMWVAGDFVMTIPLVTLADHLGHRFVLCLNLVPRIFLLGWAFVVGYFDHAMPVHAVVAAPAFSFLGGDCVFNSIVYSLVSELTDDYVLRATFFGYVNAISAIFSLQLGQALASATMSALLFLPLWIGIVLLLFAIPVISSLPSPTQHRRGRTPLTDDDNETINPLIAAPNRSPSASTSQDDFTTKATTRFRTLLAILTAPSRNFILLLAVFFLASLGSSDTKLMPLYISTRFGWRLADVGYLLSAKGLYNFVLLTWLVPRFLRWRRERGGGKDVLGSAVVAGVAVDADADVASGIGADRDQYEGAERESVDGYADEAADREHKLFARACLVASVLGALAIALSPAIIVLVPSLMLYALGLPLPMFTYSLLKSPSMGFGQDRAMAGPGTQLFSLVMLIRTVGTLLGAMLMPTLWVAALGVGGAALGLPYVASALCYGVAAVLVARMEV